MNASSPVPVSGPRRFRWGRLGVFALATLFILVAAAPSLVSWSPALRAMLLHRMAGDIHGTLSVDSLSVGWWQPAVVTGVRLEPLAGGTGPGTAAGEPLLTVERLESDRTLWHMLWNQSDVGTLRIERPAVFVKFTDQGSNFGEVFAPVLKPGAKLPATLRIGAKVRIVDGKLHGRSLENDQPWEITGVNLGVGVRAEGTTKSGRAELFVEKGTLVAQQPLAVGLCNDVLKYVAPVLADVASTSGTISIELDDWRLPWNDFGNGELSGRLTMHTVDVGPGPVVLSIIRQINAIPLLDQVYRELRLPETVQIARDSTVPFKMIAGGRIHHENLRFSVADLVDVQSHGSVGLDETLDLTTALGIHPPNAADRKLAILRVLTSQPWPVKIGGTLAQPTLDLSPLNDAWKQLVFQKLPQDWQSGNSSLGADVLREIGKNTGLPVDPQTVGPLLQMLGPLLAQPQPTPSGPAPQNGPQVGSTPRQPPPPSPNVPGVNPAPTGSIPPSTAATVPPLVQPSPADAIAEGVGTALDVLEAIRARRQAALQNRQPTPQPPGAVPAPQPPPPRRPLLNGLRNLLEPPPPPPAPTATPTAPAPKPRTAIQL